MKRVNSLYPILVIALCISCISISIGFSAMSTSLSINGTAIVDPVGMIRVLSIEQDELYNATEYNSEYSIDSINVLLDLDQNDGYATYNVVIKNLGQVDKELTKIESEIFSNDDMEYEIDGLDLGRVIKGKETVEFKITFKCKNEVLNEKKLNAKIKFRFKNYEKIILPDDEFYQADGYCFFNGKGSNVIGDCTKNNETDYIKTGITPFSEDNYLRNFILKFTINDVDLSRFTLGKRDTIFNILYEGDDKIKGKFPGVLLRIEKDKWMLQGSSGKGQNYANKIYFDVNDLLNKEIKIIRYNNNGNICLYYAIGDSDPILLKDITDLYAPFDTPLTFGASLAIDNTSADRHAYVTLEDMLFKYVDDASSLEDIVGKNNPPDIIDPIDPPVVLPDIFDLSGPCIFNGSTQNITGSCASYSDSLYINTDFKLFDSENYKKDFDLSFNLSDYDNNNQEYEQATIMNAFLERTTGKGYGMLLRKNNGNLNLIIRDGNGVNKELNFAANSVSSVRIVRKNNNICYSINNDRLKFAIDSSNQITFDVPVTFGASLDATRNPFRYIKGTISDINITLGEIDSNIVCVKQ